MTKIHIPKIRPTSWKVYVQGEENAQYVARVLSSSGLEASQPQSSPALTEPPLFAVVATPKEGIPLTEQELIHILERDEQLEVTFDKSNP